VDYARLRAVFGGGKTFSRGLVQSGRYESKRRAGLAIKSSKMFAQLTTIKVI
jgi:hypothetical protein